MPDQPPSDPAPGAAVRADHTRACPYPKLMSVVEDPSLQAHLFRMVFNSISLEFKPPKAVAGLITEGSRSFPYLVDSVSRIQRCQSLPPIFAQCGTRRVFTREPLQR